MPGEALAPVTVADEIAVDLRTLTTRRLALRLRPHPADQLSAGSAAGDFPVLERSLDFTSKGLVMLLTGYQTPAGIRRTGARHIETWLK